MGCLISFHSTLPSKRPALELLLVVGQLQSAPEVSIKMYWKHLFYSFTDFARGKKMNQNLTFGFLLY